MPFQTNGGIRFFQFDSFRGRVKHAFLARLGGVSPAPWRSLNLGGTVGDEPQRVQENRRLAFSTLGLDLVSLFDVWQVHGVEVAIADTPRRLDTPRQRADAILSNSPSVTLLMRFADCVPVLLFDPIHAVIGMVHAGWMGTVNGTLRAALNAMQERYGSQPGALYSGIGPSIGPDHYEIGPDVASQVQAGFGPFAAECLETRAGRIYFDLWKANRYWLEQAGVREIEVAGLCTACHTDDWFSHRAEHGRTGRFGALMALEAG